MFLKRSEKQFLYRKYVQNGMNSDEANKRIKNICNHLHQLVLRMRKQGKEEKTINEKFLEEFEKICMSY